ncbi:MAG: Ig-like domain-containing protein, partial [Clostridia bacterium]|nr:Ig-like domain-containing protein [Clostridia bacterium]
MRMRKVLSLVLAVVMLLSVVPAVYAEDLVLSSYQVNEATTIVGTMPLLPDRAVLTFENGDVLIEYITWNEIDESLYSAEGTFEVSGVTESGFEVKTTVTVEKDSDTDIASGLIAYYNFDTDNTNPSIISDISGNGNDAKVLNTVVAAENEWLQGANNVLTITDGIASFPGNTSEWWNNYLGAALKLPNNINSGVESFSFSAWIKADG